MIRILAIVVSLGCLAAARAEPATADKTPSTRDFTHIRQEVETLRGKPFRHEVPVYKISARALRAISDRELDKDFPGRKLDYYQDLMAWLDFVPPGTDLKSVYANFLVDQVAGLYDTDTKEMCLPAYSSPATNLARKATERKLEKLAAELEDIVLAHEFTHALEDQYWPLDVPEDHDFEVSTDRGTAHEFVAEGSASREMIEVIPGHWERELPGSYFSLWNLLHSRLGEWVLNYEFGRSWKSADALVEGVPESVARTEAMPYAFGYTFCTRILRQWGLDGLDYVYNHPPVSSTQVMHPRSYWEWRNLPVQIALPKTLPGGWKQVSLDSVGEAGLAALLGSQFRNLNRGLELARGWDGDQVGLYEDPNRQRLMFWASSWDSTNAAGRYLEAWLRERQVSHQSTVTFRRDNRISWQSPEGRAGLIVREGKRVLILERDGREASEASEVCLHSVTFTEPAADVARTAENHALLRFNPLWSWQKDGDYVVSRSLWGLLSRNDRNSVGAADRFLLGLAGEWRHTTSFHKWELGAGLLARHESEARRGVTTTTLLPWGILASHGSARLPQEPERTLSHTSVLWAVGASVTHDETGRDSLRVLPFGLLLQQSTGPGQSSFHVLGTGLSRREMSGKRGLTTRFRLLGIPLWTTHSSAAAKSGEGGTAHRR